MRRNTHSVRPSRVTHPSLSGLITVAGCFSFFGAFCCAWTDGVAPSSAAPVNIETITRIGILRFT